MDNKLWWSFRNWLHEKFGIHWFDYQFNERTCLICFKKEKWDPYTSEWI